MSITELKGDLLKSDCKIIIHCCNCFNTMGGGIAKSIAKKWPGAKAADDKTKYGDKSKLGNFTFYQNDDILVFNLYGQYKYGRDKRNVNYEALIHGLYKIKKFLIEKKLMNLKIGTYRLGCGLAGGNWDIVKPILEEVFDDIEVQVYSL